MSERWSLIFDCDGTLVDSEPLLARELAVTFTSLGLPFEPQDYMLDYRGVAFPFILADLETRHGRKVDDMERRKELEQQMRASLEERMKQELEPIDGVAEALEALSAHPRCVASNGPLRKIKLSMSLSGLAAQFGDHLYSAYEVGIWKPDPGLYLYAAKALDTPPERCIVIDDAAVGLKSGIDAGMQVIHLNRFSERERTPEEAHEIRAMAQLPSMVEKIIAERSAASA
ncbi:HAD family hydrolase [Halotalea alkalilenta]|uniref:Haloacid dehalogenase n=1 Tax=Halotalea alkalilenta TaxID=376489 RepID=A0A172YCP1_9GAMM|nr:HAD-IA family hydrolase [Halotalea alkalilenta]ANF57019.1 hypothetical protein A5892_05675 [Halotalea alkalilenta]